MENDLSPLQTRLSQSTLDLIDSEDEGGIKKIFYISTQTTPTTSLPMLARSSKALCGKFFHTRLMQVRSPLQGLAAALVNTRSGQLDWIGGGPYRLEFAEGKAVKAKYSNNDEVEVADQCTITDGFEIKEPWCIWNAVAIKGIQTYPMHELFAPDKGPYRYKLDKKGIILRQLARQVDTAMKQAEAQQKLGIVADEQTKFVGEARMAKKREALKQAQAKAAANTKRRRVVTLATT